MFETLEKKRSLPIMAFWEQLSADEANWFQQAQLAIADSDNLTQAEDYYARSSAMLGRRLGQAGLASGNWQTDQLGRLLLLIALLQAKHALDPRTADVCLIERVFHQADTAEKVALLKGLYYLVDDNRLMDLCLQASRHHDTRLLAALLLDNPYPVTYAPAPLFNQLVLKALFADLDISRIPGLAGRLNPDLSRLVRELIEACVLTDQPLAAAACLAMKLEHLPMPFFQEHYCQLLNSDSDIQRYFSVLGLWRNGLPSDTRGVWAVLDNALAVEESAVVKHLMGCVMERCAPDNVYYLHSPMAVLSSCQL